MVNFYVSVRRMHRKNGRKDNASPLKIAPAISAFSKSDRSLYAAFVEFFRNRFNYFHTFLFQISKCKLEFIVQRRRGRCPHRPFSDFVVRYTKIETNRGKNTQNTAHQGQISSKGRCGHRPLRWKNRPLN